VLAFAAFEVIRSLGRIDGVIFTGYTQLGEVVLQGGDPYGLTINTWPPFFSIVAAGLALAARVSLPGALFFWQVGSVLAIWGCVRILARWFLDDGERLTFWPRSDGGLSFSSPSVFVPVLLTARLFQEHLQHTQVNLFVLLLCLWAFQLFRRKKQVLGGLALAAAASLKAVPVVLVGYLAYRRRWREMAWTIGFLVALNVWLPAERWRSWRAVAAAEMADPTPHYPNQSMLAAVKRLVTVEGGARDPVRYPVAAWSPAAVRTAFTVTAGLAALGLALAFGVRPPDLGSRRAATEWAICLGAMTIVSPLAWKAHYVTLLAPYFVAWGMLRGPAPPGRWRWALLWGSVACLTLSAPVFVGERINDVLESLNVITAGAVMVLVLATLPPPPPRASSAAHSSH
jgi:glycosyl transferase family 87